jgi:FkbM family methyltransferase
VHEPDPHVREVFASLLTNCHLRDCQCVDIGANVGYMTVLMASMGASVISVEPYFDYGQALKRTVELNCWTDRVQVHQGFATMDAAQAGKRQWVNSTYRSMGEHVPPVVTGWNAPFINIADLIKGKSLELVKIDTDTVDGFLLKGLIELITTGNLEVKSIVTEFMAGDASILHTFQQKLGYDIYRLNVHDDRRFFDDTGHDVISHFGDIKLEPFFEERYFLRYIKFAFKLKNRPNLADWEPVIKTREGLNEATLQYLITKVALEEHQFQHPVARARPNGVGP